MGSCSSPLSAGHGLRSLTAYLSSATRVRPPSIHRRRTAEYRHACLRGWLGVPIFRKARLGRRERHKF